MSEQKIECQERIRQSHELISEFVSTTYGGSPSPFPVLSSRTRIRWTRNLHEKFVECVNCLGGAYKASPEAILKLMDVDGLTIFHVKIHLQKYRIAAYPPDPAGEKSEKKTTLNAEPLLDVKTGLEIKEALQLELDVQRHLHELLETQRYLQFQIEEQLKQLQKMFDLQQKASDNLSENQMDTTFYEGAPLSNLDDEFIGLSINR